jgi:hypothetical protein
MSLPLNEASTTVPVRGVTKLPPVDLETYPPARLLFFTLKPHGCSKQDVCTHFSFLFALKEVDAQFSEQFDNDAALRKVYCEMRMDSYSRKEIEGDGHLYSLVLMLENALKTRLRFAVLQHLSVVSNYEYIVSYEAQSGIEARKKALMESGQEVLVVLSILENWATDELHQQCDAAWDVLGLNPLISTTTNDSRLFLDKTSASANTTYPA